MKVRNITTPNQKGQIVIPKRIREQLGITESTAVYITLEGPKVVIYPVHHFVPGLTSETPYLDVLKTTQGSWAKESTTTSSKRRAVELRASKQRKAAW